MDTYDYFIDVLSCITQEMKLIASIALLALAASQVSAYCPNLCSGHGACGASDKCTCYKYIGTGRGDHVSSSYMVGLRAAWTGADCSLRTCPLSYSWSGATPNGLSATTTLITPGVTSGAFAFKVGTTDLVTNQQNLSVGSKVRITSVAGTQLLTIRSATWDATNNAFTTYEAITATHNTGSSVYYAPAEEERSLSPLDAKDASGAHGMLECAGQGICDRATGNCDCFPGYEGEACTRSVCPNDCSGNGICLSAKRLADDSGNSNNYNYAWDADKHFGCKCDVGFRGPDCSLQECPSDYDPMHGCGGGECNNKIDVACPNNGFSDCASNEQRDCSGRGLCDYESGTCKCFSGFFGQACENQTILI